MLSLCGLCLCVSVDCISSADHLVKQMWKHTRINTHSIKTYCKNSDTSCTPINLRGNFQLSSSRHKPRLQMYRARTVAHTPGLLDELSAHQVQYSKSVKAEQSVGYLRICLQLAHRNKCCLDQGHGFEGPGTCILKMITEIVLKISASKESHCTILSAENTYLLF